MRAITKVRKRRRAEARTKGFLEVISSQDSDPAGRRRLEDFNVKDFAHFPDKVLYFLPSSSELELCKQPYPIRLAKLHPSDGG